MAKKTTKSETLTIRLDPKSRFMLEFVARLRGQTITTVVERAIEDAANQATIHSDLYGDKLGWRDFWHVVEGVRSLKMYKEQELRPDFDEERRLEFATKHWPFFFTSSECSSPHRTYIELLWPQIDDLIQFHEQHKNQNYFAAGDRMCETLREANVVPPEWPPKAEIKKQSTSVVDMDDDIPF